MTSGIELYFPIQKSDVSLIKALNTRLETKIASPGLCDSNDKEPGRYFYFNIEKAKEIARGLPSESQPTVAVFRFVYLQTTLDSYYGLSFSQSRRPYWLFDQMISASVQGELLHDFDYIEGFLVENMEEFKGKGALPEVGRGYVAVFDEYLLKAIFNQLVLTLELEEASNKWVEVLQEA